MSSGIDVVEVPVKVEEGLFGTDVLARFAQIDGQQLSLYLDRDLLHRSSDGSQFFRLPVTSRSQGVLTAILPCEAIETMSRWIQLPDPTSE